MVFVCHCKYFLALLKVPINIVGGLFVCVPGRASVRGGPRQPASTCKSVRTTYEPWTCLMNSALLSLTTWLKDNTWASSAPHTSSSSSAVDGSFSDDENEQIQQRHTELSECWWFCVISPVCYKAFHTAMSVRSLRNQTCNLTRQSGDLSDCTLHYVTAAPVTRNCLKLRPRFSSQFSQYLSHLVKTGQREQPLQSDASCPVHCHQNRFTFNFCEDVFNKHLCARNRKKRHSKKWHTVTNWAFQF